MVKNGIVFDYDLAANYQLTGNEICEICNSPLQCRWTDRHGEGICLICGAPYQLMHGSKEQETEGNYPYLLIKPEWIPILREYWEKEKKFRFGGWSVSEDKGQEEFKVWVSENYPDMLLM